MSKKYKAFRFVVILLFVTFMTLYFSQITGYYEFQNYRRMTMTREQIEQFEQDIRDGVPVDIRNYVIDHHIDYQNRFSNTGSRLSARISESVTSGIERLFGAISDHMTE